MLDEMDAECEALQSAYRAFRIGLSATPTLTKHKPLPVSGRLSFRISIICNLYFFFFHIYIHPETLLSE